MKKRSLSLVLAFAMILALTCGAWAALAPNADGVYEIGTAAELAEFRDMVNAGSNDIDGKLTANITLPDEPWMIIGSHVFDSFGSKLEDRPYAGTFDGNGHTISNLKIRSSDLSASGTHAVGALFGYLCPTGVVQNLIVKNVDIDVSDNTISTSISAIVGHLSAGTVKNCGVIGGRIKGTDTAGGSTGGVVGFGGTEDHGAGEISGCFVEGLTLIEGSGNVGGISGNVTNGLQVSNCYVSDITKMKAGGFLGGLVGWINYSGVGLTVQRPSFLKNSYAQDILALEAGHSAGLLVGALYGQNDAEMSNCVYVGTGTQTTLTGSTNEGGLVGYFLNTAADLGKLQNALYPDTNIDFSKGIDRPIGNISSDDINDEDRNDLLPYSTASADSELPAVVVALEQGYTITLVVGETYELDVTTFPGTVGNFVGHWESSNSGIVSVASENDGLFATLTAVEVGAAEVLVKVRGTVNVDLTCNVIVVDAVDVTTDPADDSIYLNDEDVNIVYNFDPYTVFDIDTSGLAGSGLDAIIDPDDNSQVLLTKTGVLQAGSYFYVVTLEGADGSFLTQTVPVVIQGGSRPTGGGGGGSSNCNSGVGAAMFALLGLAFVYKRK